MGSLYKVPHLSPPFLFCDVISDKDIYGIRNVTRDAIIMDRAHVGKCNKRKIKVYNMGYSQAVTHPGASPDNAA